jgi:hypothetical protein
MQKCMVGGYLFYFARSGVRFTFIVRGVHFLESGQTGDSPRSYFFSVYLYVIGFNLLCKTQ